MRIDQILAELSRLRPGARATFKLQATGDRALMKTLKAGGLRAVARLVKALNANGRRFEPAEAGPGVRFWRENLDGRAFEIRVWSNRVCKMAALRYMPVRELTRAERELQAVQKLFYDRYMAIGQKAYRNRRQRLSLTDRRLLLVGELEADVNNGGFAQYLHNKGARRARSAVAALKAIGAAKTAGMLLSAMAPGVTEAKLAALDDQFYQAPEDLAVLGARHVRLK